MSWVVAIAQRILNERMPYKTTIRFGILIQWRDREGIMGGWISRVTAAELLDETTGSLIRSLSRCIDGDVNQGLLPMAQLAWMVEGTLSSCYSGATRRLFVRALAYGRPTWSDWYQRFRVPHDIQDNIFICDRVPAKTPVAINHQHCSKEPHVFN